MLATIIISLILLVIVGFAVRSVVRSRKTGGCSACGDSSSCPSCSKTPDLSNLKKS